MAGALSPHLGRVPGSPAGFCHLLPEKEATVSQVPSAWSPPNPSHCGRSEFRPGPLPARLSAVRSTAPFHPHRSPSEIPASSLSCPGTLHFPTSGPLHLLAPASQIFTRLPPSHRGHQGTPTSQGLLLAPNLKQPTTPPPLHGLFYFLQGTF